ncbi:ricin-type beta-trefoil lectin domain protein [Actinomadura scrupuli]|uniref:ricin-type beta-trefoil lectin domain protein n=1 Tax=Actinomadura scrupuli TaxID=559629 RepID=UPI003D9729B3
MGELTTPTSTTTANPDGTFDQAQSLEPTRILQAGIWKDLDPTLHANPDGTYSPNVTTTDVVLSGGGIGPLVRLANDDRAVSLGWLPLPAPAVSGPTATYSEVITGVDLVVTVEDDGTTSDVLVLKTKAAASNPFLAVLQFAVGLTSGTSLVKNGDGSLDVTADTAADPVYTAEPPIMWDSSTAPSDTSPPTGDGTDVNPPPDDGTLSTPGARGKAKTAPSAGRASGVATASSTEEPGAFARIARVKTAVTAGSPATAAKKQPGAAGRASAVTTVTGGQETTLTLTPDQAMLNDPATVYPVYIDPRLAPVTPYKGGNADQNGTWAQRTDKFGYKWHPTKKHSDTGRTEHNLQVGFMGWVPANTNTPVGPGAAGTFTARSYVQLPIAPELHQNATVIKSELDVTAWHAPSWSCDVQPTRADLYVTGNITKSGGPGWAKSGSEIGHDSSPTCSGRTLGFNLTNFMKNFLRDNPSTNKINLMLKAHSEANAYGWMQIKPKDIRIVTRFNRPPAAPSHLTTSPGGPCKSDPTKTIIGNDDVIFSAVPSDPDGGQLDTTFHIVNETGTEVKATTIRTNNGTPAIPPAVTRATFQQTWSTDGAAHKYTWYATTTDGQLTGPSSARCGFTYDPRAPQAPGLKIPAPPSGVPGDPIGAIGQSVDFQVAPCQSKVADTPQNCTYGPTDAPTTGYVYQINGGPPITVPAVTGGGAQPLHVRLTRYGVNTISVKAMAASGTPGDLAVNAGVPGTPFTFSVSRPVASDGTPAPYRDGDLDGDGNPDLLLNGNAGGAGVWLAQAGPDGRLSTPVNIGADGPGINAPPTAGDWNGAQILHGDFTGQQVQDLAAYYPASNPDRPGQAYLLSGTGDGGPLSPYLGQQTLKASRLRDPQFRKNTAVPSQLIAAGNATGKTNPGPPDLIGILGDDKGRELIAYSTVESFGIYTKSRVIALPGNTDGFGTYQGDQSPDGSSWAGFTLAAVQRNGTTVLFALKSDGKLWSSTATATTLPGAPGTWTQITVPAAPAGKTSWADGSTLVSADVNRNGVTELWLRTGSAGTATNYTLSADGKTLATATTSSLAAPAHDWVLHDGEAATQAVDANGADGTLHNITWTAPGDNPGHGTVPSFDGTTSFLTLPQPLGASQQAATISLSFQAKPGSAGILLSTADSASDGSPQASNNTMPVMYIGTDGRLYAQLWAGHVLPMTSAFPVNDGQWHTATLTLNGQTHEQILYVDNNIAVHSAYRQAIRNAGSQLYIGAGTFPPYPWVNAPGTAGTLRTSYFSGQVSDIAYYTAPLTQPQVAGRGNRPAPMTGPINLDRSAKCINDFQTTGNPPLSGDKIVFWDCNGNAQQRWTLNPNSTITLASMGGTGDNGSGLCLTVPNGSAPGAPNGAQLILSSCLGNGASQWQILANGAIYNPTSGKCIDDPGFGTTNGLQLDIWDCAGSTNEAWTSPARITPPIPTGTVVNTRGNLCVNSQTTANGSPVKVEQCTGAASQQWTLQSPSATGTITYAGKCLDITNGSNALSTPIQLTACNSGAYQQWHYDPVGGALLNPTTGLCLDAGPGTAGTQLKTYTCNQTTAQIFIAP